MSIMDSEMQYSKNSLFDRVGRTSLQGTKEVREVLDFIGVCTLAFFRVLTKRHRFQWQETWFILQQCGANALPIVTLISFLVGMIMAYVGSVQLQQFGATLFIANLVGLAMVREMGAMMTGVIMCGRTGAAFAAQLGTMKVSEEIAALQTLDVCPIEFLVIPRIVALFLMMPLLTLYANFVGIVGGLVVAVGMEVSVVQYIRQVAVAVDLYGFSTGLIKSTVFGVVVAVCGCLRGMQCGKDSAAVGAATTSAVVCGITSLIVVDALFAVLFNIIGI